MVNKQTAQILLDRLPLTLLFIEPDIMDMLEWKFGGHDGLFHSVKATIKQFPKFKDTEVKSIENRAMEFIDQALIDIYRCLHCGTDIRKCGVIRRRTGVETAEFFVSEDGKPSRTHKDKFEHNGKIDYSCLSCHNNIDGSQPVIPFLHSGINKDVCIDYLYKFHNPVMQKVEKLRTIDRKMDRQMRDQFGNVMPINWHEARPDEIDMQHMQILNDAARVLGVDRGVVIDRNRVDDGLGGNNLGGQLQEAIAEN